MDFVVPSVFEYWGEMNLKNIVKFNGGFINHGVTGKKTSHPMRVTFEAKYLGKRPHNIETSKKSMLFLGMSVTTFYY